MKKVILVDDENLFTEGIYKFLTEKTKLEVLNSFSNGKLLLSFLNDNKTKPDLIIMDLKMEGMNGIDTLKILSKKHSNIRVIILSSYYNPTFAKYLSTHKINSFLPKNIGQEDLLDAINGVIKNGTYFLPCYDKLLNSTKKTNTKKPILNTAQSLSKKEIEVLKYICHGYTNQEIADKLYKSIRTIEGHRQNIIDKTGTKNTAGIVVFAIMHKLIDIDKKLVNYHISPKWITPRVV